MLQNAFYFLLAPLLSMQLSAGSGTAYLQCKSASGKTVFYAELQDIDGLLEKAHLTIEGIRVNYTPGDARTIFDKRLGVLTFYIQNETDTQLKAHKFLKFWSIPSSFKIIKNTESHQEYEFKAKILGSEPRKGKGKYLITPVITLKCTLVYKI
ncbi:hypothetical protein BKI52_36530 [marine bacterium AO1-C]|nr:hypothetical protein BKI52_36530 [marine bacterium AO1-C]